EFLHVNDLARAVVFAMERRLPDYLYNVGSGTDVTIEQLARTIQEIVGHKGDISWDSSKPDGTPRKLMDSSKLKSLGWKNTITLTEGISNTYQWFLENEKTLKKINL